MTPELLRQYSSIMVEFGVCHFKVGDAEISIRESVNSRPSLPEENDSDPIKHKVQEMSSLLKLDDKDLVDRLFPDTSENKED